MVVEGWIPFQYTDQGGQKIPGRSELLEQMTVYFVSREWNQPVGLDRVYLEMGLGGGKGKSDSVQIEQSFEWIELYFLGQRELPLEIFFLAEKRL